MKKENPDLGSKEFAVYRQKVMTALTTGEWFMTYRRDQEDAFAQLEAMLRSELACGNELQAWDAFCREHAIFPENELLMASRALIELDFGCFMQSVSASTSPGRVCALVESLEWNDSFGDRWLRASNSRRLAALGFLLWFRRLVATERPSPTIAPTDEMLSRLSLLGDALSSRERSEEIALWWQAIGIAFRLCPDPNGSGRVWVSALYGEAARRLAGEGVATDVLPDDAQLTGWSRFNSGSMAVLPYVAERLDVTRQAPLLHAFFSNAQVRLESPVHERPVGDRLGNYLYLEACAKAIALDIAGGHGSEWWEQSLGRYCLALRGWRSDWSEPSLSRLGWIICAACLGAMMLADAGDARWRSLATKIFAVTDAELPEWMWWCGKHSSVINQELPVLLVHVAIKDGDTAAQRVLQIAREVRETATLTRIREVVAANGVDQCLGEVDSLLRRQKQFDEQLMHSEDDW